MKLKQKVMSGLAWSVAGRFIAQAITWAITVVIIRILSPEDYGLLALATVFIGLLSLINEMGMGAGIVQRKDVDVPILKSLFSLIIFFSLVFYLFLYLLAPFIAGYFSEPRLVLLIKVLGLEFLINGFSVIPRSLLIREMKFRQIAIVEFASNVTGSVVTLVLALLGYGVWALVLGMLSIRVVATIGFTLSQPFIHMPSKSMQGMRAFFAIGGYVTFSRILWYLYSRADILIVGKVFGKEILGFYSVGLMLAQLPMDKIAGIVNQVAFSAYSSIQNDLELAGKYFLKSVRVISFLAFPVLWGISSISDMLVDVALGSQWAEASTPLKIIALIVPLRLISTFFSPLLVGLGRPDISLRNILTLSFVMPLSFFIGTYWGILGVCLAWVFAFPCAFLFNVMRLVKVLKIKISSVIFQIYAPALCSFLMYMIVKLSEWHIFKFEFHSYNLICMIIIGIISYSIFSLIFLKKHFYEIMGLLKNK
jgi:O-antigen/teichoic acid export membrane protein